MKKNDKAVRGIGIDIAEIGRFKKFNKTSPFLKRIFFKKELDYCFSFKDAGTHLAGCFAAKEAAVKAYGGKTNIFDVELRHTASGAPELYKNNKKLKDALVSITHTEKIACALVLVI